MSTILEFERTARGWSQTELGYLAGSMAQSHISAYENRKKSCGLLRQHGIAKILGMLPADLFDEQTGLALPIHE